MAKIKVAIIDRKTNELLSVEESLLEASIKYNFDLGTISKNINNKTKSKKYAFVKYSEYDNTKDYTEPQGRRKTLKSPILVFSFNGKLIEEHKKSGKLTKAQYQCAIHNINRNHITGYISSGDKIYIMKNSWDGKEVRRTRGVRRTSKPIIIYDTYHHRHHKFDSIQLASEWLYELTPSKTIKSVYTNIQGNIDKDKLLYEYYKVTSIKKEEENHDSRN